MAERAISGSVGPAAEGFTTMSLATAATPLTARTTDSAFHFSQKVLANPLKLTSRPITFTAMSVSSISGLHRSSASTSRLISLSDLIMVSPGMGRLQPAHPPPNVEEADTLTGDQPATHAVG